jgi:hypothetical protein
MTIGDPGLTNRRRSPPRNLPLPLVGPYASVKDYCCGTRAGEAALKHTEVVLIHVRVTVCVSVFTSRGDRTERRISLALLEGGEIVFIHVLVGVEIEGNTGTGRSDADELAIEELVRIGWEGRADQVICVGAERKIASCAQ